MLVSGSCFTNIYLSYVNLILIELLNKKYDFNQEDVI